VVWQQLAGKQGRAFFKHVIPAVVKPARTLWNEVIGFLFISLGVYFGFLTVLHAHEAVRVVFGVPCTVMMLWYGISSFRTARKISRS
jgi:hypothetical protein